MRDPIDLRGTALLVGTLLVAAISSTNRLPPGTYR